MAPIQKAAKSKKSRAKKTVQVDNVMQMVQGQPMPSNVTGITGEQSGRNRRKAITSSQKVLVSV